jgi:putative pyruvate formate lyase activating enzyme
MTDRLQSLLTPKTKNNKLLTLENCTICPHACGVNRKNKQGLCKSGDKLKISTFQLHHWEEPVISGDHGSGTIFFSGCNMHCVYCQNFEISQLNQGNIYSTGELAEMMITLQNRQAHNINLVTPTHFTPLVIDALEMAKAKGLNIPVVWNSNAYELPQTLSKLEGLVDIYLPDLRYAQDEQAIHYSGAKNYFSMAQKALLEMKRQTGNLKTDKGIAWKGVMIRLLVLPGNLNKVDKSLEWIAENLGTKTWISLLGQYYPAYRAVNYMELNKGIEAGIYNQLAEYAEELGFENGYFQKTGSSDYYTPDFRK